MTMKKLHLKVTERRTEFGITLQHVDLLTSTVVFCAVELCLKK